MKRSARAAIVALAAGLVLAGLLGSTGCTAARVPPPAGLGSGETTQASVFFATGRTLFEEYRVVPVDDVYGRVLAEWLEAMPQENPDVALVQPVAEVLSVTLADGVLTIDWSAEILRFDADDREERIALAGILRTFGQFPEVEQVAFTVQGQADGEVDGLDIQDFWGSVSLRDQPWDVLRPSPPIDDGASEDATSAP